MSKSIGIYVSEKDVKRIEYLSKVYDCKVSELIRILVEKEYRQIMDYKELNINDISIG